MTEETTGLPVSRSETPEGEVGTAQHQRWRVGRTVPINVYEDDRPVCQCHNAEDARRIVAAMNDWCHAGNGPRCNLCATSLAAAIRGGLCPVSEGGAHEFNATDLDALGGLIPDEDLDEFIAETYLDRGAAVQSPAPPPNGSTAEGTQGGK